MSDSRFILVLVCVATMVLGCEPKAKPSEDMSAKAQTPANVAAAEVAPPKQAVTDASFSVEGTTHSVTVGEPKEVTFEVRPAKGFKINPEFPWAVTLEGSKPLGLVGATMSKEQLDVDATRVKVSMALNPMGSGKHFIKGSANISVCETTGAKKCLWFNEEPVTIEVDAVKL